MTFAILYCITHLDLMIIMSLCRHKHLSSDICAGLEKQNMQKSKAISAWRLKLIN